MRHSLTNSGEFEVQGHKLLSDTTNVVEEGRPHWLSNGLVRKTADSIRGKSLVSLTRLGLSKVHPHGPGVGCSVVAGNHYRAQPASNREIT